MASWLVAVAACTAVGVMGFAIQRGGTCTVAAMDELLNQRRARRLVAMAEASLWVAGGLLLAQLADLAPGMPAGYEITRWTLLGGALLGLGAWVNGACVFGAIARLGSGQWAQALTPLGFFVGSMLAVAWMQALPLTQPRGSALPSPLWGAAAWIGPLFVLYAAWRVGPPLACMLRGSRQGVAARLAERVWAPHAATIVIGISSVATWLLAGRWAYTDVLADLAQGMTRGGWPGLALPLVLLAALYAGALLGGWTAGLWQHAWPTWRDTLRPLGGGALMGLGSLLIPGSNDGLILIGLPLLRPHAWLAFASMGLAIGVALLLARGGRASAAA